MFDNSQRVVALGGEGSDGLTSGPAADRLEGGSGSDGLVGGPGSDDLLGGPDIDEVFCTEHAGDVVVDLDNARDDGDPAPACGAARRR